MAKWIYQMPVNLVAWQYDYYKRKLYRVLSISLLFLLLSGTTVYFLVQHNKTQQNLLLQKQQQIKQIKQEKQRLERTIRQQQQRLSDKNHLAVIPLVARLQLLALISHLSEENIQLSEVELAADSKSETQHTVLVRLRGEGQDLAKFETATQHIEMNWQSVTDMQIAEFTPMSDQSYQFQLQFRWNVDD